MTEKYTVLVENVLLNRDTGYPAKQSFLLYSAPTDLPMAKSLAAQLRMVNKSYRIVTKDYKPGFEIIEQWWRKDFFPTDGNEKNLIKESNDATSS